MNVPEVKLLSSSLSADSVSSMEEEVDEGKDGNEEGKNTRNSTKSKTNSSLTDNTEEDQQQEDPTMQKQKLTEHCAKNEFNSTMGGKDLHVLFAMAIGYILKMSWITKNLLSVNPKYIIQKLFRMRVHLNWK